MPSIPGRIRSICSRPESSRLARSICVLSPVITAREFTPSRVRNIFICIRVAFCASSWITNASDNVPLPRALGPDHPAQPGEDDLELLLGAGLGEVSARAIEHQPLHVVHVQLLPHAGQVDHRLDHGRGALHRRPGPLQRETVPAQRHAHAEPLAQLDQVGVVDAGERQWIHAFDGDALGEGVAHGTTLRWRVARSSARAGAGAPSNSARAAVVLGNAMTSRHDPAPAASINTRSTPTAKPPCGGAPAARPWSKNPKRSAMSWSESPRCRNTVRCTAPSVMRIDPEPSSLPL